MGRTKGRTLSLTKTFGTKHAEGHRTPRLLGNGRAEVQKIGRQSRLLSELDLLLFCSDLRMDIVVRGRH